MNFSSQNNMGAQVGNNGSVAPSLPPRPVPVTDSFMPGVGAAGMYSAYSPYSNYSYAGYGGVMNRPPMYGGYGGAGPAMPSDFVRVAEENSRNALQSVESVVQTLSSIAYMLESSLAAVHSSFRAVLGVADQFSRLKQFTLQLLSTLTIIRLIRNLYRRFLVLIRLKPANYANAESAWFNATTQAASSPNRSWYSTLFFVFVVGGPWLLSKLVSKLAQSVEDSNKWATGEGPHYLGVANYTFITSQPGELALECGQTIRIAPKEKQPQVKGWLLASNMDGSKIGLVPYNYIEIKALPQQQ